MATRGNPAGRRVTVLLAAAVIEGAFVSSEIVAGVELDDEVLEGASLAAEVMGD